ncbi:MAG: cupredoxin domain-containing protein [Chloroflexi bacterium]|nr:cupredoxin domain-containing protein [Chloroflexota bacterium]
MATGLLLGVVIAACGGPASTTGTIKLTLSEFKYSPSTIDLAAGEKTTLELRNSGTVEHDLIIDAAGLKVSVQPGKTATRNLGPLSSGSYEIYCSVAGHKESGMKGHLTVK